MQIRLRLKTNPISLPVLQPVCRHLIFPFCIPSFLTKKGNWRVCAQATNDLAGPQKQASLPGLSCQVLYNACKFLHISTNIMQIIRYAYAIFLLPISSIFDFARTLKPKIEKVENIQQKSHKITPALTALAIPNSACCIHPPAIVKSLPMSTMEALKV